jgi:hypothetical protein
LLAGFTLPKTPDRLWVIDTKRIKLFPANIKDITTDKDFYRITPADESGDPFAVEKLLGEIESKALPIIRQIDETGCMLKGEDREHLLLFLAVLRLRVRFFRSQLDGALSQVLRHMLDLSMATKDRWDSSLAKVYGADVPADHPDYETCKKILAEDGLNIQVGRNMLIKSMFDAVGDLRVVPAQNAIPLFANRICHGAHGCNTTCVGTRDPGIQHAPGVGLAGLAIHITKCLFEQVRPPVRSTQPGGVGRRVAILPV